MSKNIINARNGIEQIESKYAALLDRKTGSKQTTERKCELLFKNIINNLIEFEIEIAGGEVSIQSAKHDHPPQLY